jgi:DNA helicase-2/ATP-dependent DNA helicase PcrA
VRSDPEHDAVVACEEPYQVVVAPPGTGKTYLSVRLAGALARRLAPHERILLLTFSRQARAQLEREAGRQLTREQRRQVEVTNYHRLCWQAVSAYRRALALPDVLDVGSSRRRAAALRAVSPEAIQVLRAHTSLSDSLAEHAFAELHDQRTPNPELLAALLTVVDTEQRAGRLVFDDFGALFWRLLAQHPTVARAYELRYPVVIADEHQDASALQDAIVRRFGRTRLVVFADHMQLIHGYRGADLERLRRHWRDSGAQHELNTPHRWHGRAEEGTWLLGLRSALEGRACNVGRPGGLVLKRYPAERGLNGALPQLKWVLPDLITPRGASVAVLVRDNQDLGQVRNYLSSHGFYPRQLGGPKDFEEARDDIEQLPLLNDPQSVALRARNRLLALVPGLPRGVADQLERRLKADGPNLTNAKQPAAALLQAFQGLWAHGPAAYFETMNRLLVVCADQGYHFPRLDAIRAIRRTAEALVPDEGLEVGLSAYNDHVMATMHATPQQTDRGLFVMTAHQAKGKEFDAVVLLPLDARRWPDDSEHRRLLYVALTRATRRWVLIVPSADASPLVSLIP